MPATTNDYMNHFADKAAAYHQFRPHYPKELFEYLVQLTQHRGRAWDVGTGNGQAAVALSSYFKDVIATDLKQGQLDAAEKKKNIHYIACSAEKALTIQDHSIDLITVAQALHWFKLNEFYQEVRRVANTHCVLAAWCYTLIKISPDIDALVNHLYSDILGDQYWPKERKYIDEKYATIPFPINPIKTPEFTIKRSLNFSQLIGYLNTWSALQEYKIHNNNKNPLEYIEEDLKKAWGNPQKEYLTYTPIYLLAGLL